MCGKWIDLDLGEGIELRVFVLCSPNDPKSRLKAQARRMVRQRLEQKEQS